VKRPWLWTALLAGVLYVLVGLTFSALSGSATSRGWFLTWRLGAWVVSAAVYGAHVGYEHFRLRHSPPVTALHVATAVAFGGFGLAVAATVHALLTPAAKPNLRLFALALVLWPLITALPAYAVALAGTSALRLLPRRAWSNKDDAMIIKTVLAAVALAGLIPLVAAAHQGTKAPKPVSAFDGKTFTGWDGNLSIFRIEDGAIVGGSLKDKIVRNEFLCTTRAYGDFELRLKFKLLGGDTANAGVQFRTKRIPNNHEVSGYQADMGAGWWGALYDESRRNKVLIGPDQEKMKQVVKPTEWNDYVIRAEGTHIQLWINGVQTVDYVENDPSIESRGVICPQIHAGPPGEAWYKDITIVDLTK
jgi:hypothetical protein